MIQYCRYLFVKMKVFNYSELHFSEVTFYRIHTLIGQISIKTIFFLVLKTVLLEESLYNDFVCSECVKVPEPEPPTPPPEVCTNDCHDSEFTPGYSCLKVPGIDKCVYKCLKVEGKSEKKPDVA